MRFHRVAEDLFSSQTSVRVLRTLMDAPARQFTGRELATVSRTPPVRALECLRRLEGYGLVTARPLGRSIGWTLRASHAIVPGLQSWFAFERGLRKGVLDDIRATLAPLPFVRRVVLFGSVARGQETPESDLDVLVVVDHEGHKPAAETACRQLDARFRATFTNPLRPLIYDQRELHRKSNLAVVRNIEREGEVLVDKTPIKTEKLDRAKGGIYLRKAQEFVRSMQQAASRQDWNAAGLAAVHAVISAADALTTSHLGVRSRAQDHEAVVQLLRNLPTKSGAAKADQALDVLRVKNLVEYEARDFERDEASATVKKAERFVAWARAELEP